MSSGSTADSAEHCWRKVEEMIEGMFAGGDMESFGDFELRDKTLEELLGIQLAVDSVSDGNHEEIASRIKTGTELVKRVAGECAWVAEKISRRRIEGVEKIPVEKGRRMSDLCCIRETKKFSELLKMYGDAARHTDIADDCLERFVEFCSATDFDFAKRYEDDMTLVDIACLTGSPKIFKYLLANNCPVSDRTCYLAVAGGSTEIIHTLETAANKKFDRQDCLDAAIIFHRHDILHWLLRRHRFSKNIRMCVVARNNYALIVFLRLSGSVDVEDLAASVVSSNTLAAMIISDVLRDDTRDNSVSTALAECFDAVVASVILKNMPQVYYGLLSKVMTFGSALGLEYLLDNGLDPDTEIGLEGPLLTHAVILRDCTLAEMLVERGARPELSRLPSLCPTLVALRHIDTRSPDPLRMLKVLGVPTPDIISMSEIYLTEDSDIYKYLHNL